MGHAPSQCAVQDVSLAAPLQQIPLHICSQAFSICYTISLLHSAVSPFSPSNSFFFPPSGNLADSYVMDPNEKKDWRQQQLVPEKIHEEEGYIFFMMFIRKEDCHLSLGNILLILEIQA